MKHRARTQGQLLSKPRSPYPRNERRAKSLTELKKTASPVLDHEGQNRNLAKKSLEANEKRFRALIEYSSDVVILVNVEGTILFVSPSADRVYGFDPKERLGKNAFEFIHPDDLPLIKNRFIQLVEHSGTTISIEMRLWHKDGTWHWTEVTGTNLLEEPSVGAIVVNYHDIDKRKRGEEALEEEHNFALQVMNAMGQGLTVTDADGRFVFVNPAYARMVGYAAEDLIGKKPQDVTAAEDHPILSSEHARRHRGETSSYENRLIDKEGKIIPVQITGVPRMHKGAVCGAIAIVVDLTERKRVEEDLRSLSITDYLTGLYNRRGFLILAEQPRNLAKRLNKKLLLLFVDIDGLKRINDTRGHRQGDRALIEIADLLRGTFRQSDLIARVGGDEFVVLGIVVPEENAEKITARLQANLDARNARGDLGYALTISRGLACSNPENPCSIDELLAQADALMYEHKQSKRS